jgi:hypothetical protein
MARVNITLNDELDNRFRSAVAQSIGFKKGNLQLAIEQAIEEWIKQHGSSQRAVSSAE